MDASHGSTTPLLVIGHQLCHCYAKQIVDPRIHPALRLCTCIATSLQGIQLTAMETIAFVHAGTFPKPTYGRIGIIENAALM